MWCPHKIIVTINDKMFVEKIAEHLQAEGFDILDRKNLEDAISSIMACGPSMVMIEKVLPGLNEFLACQQIRRIYDGPIIILTEKMDDLEELRAFEMGADDYVCKSVHLSLLTARIKSVIKRAFPKKANQSQPIGLEDLRVNPSKRDAFIGDRPLNLTSIQFDILWYLIRRKGQVVGRDDLNQMLYNTPYNGIDRSIDVYVSRIRHKIEDDPSHPVYLKTVRGVGYIFTGD